ncbi:olfactory receptor 10A7-like [Pelodiscus sinensis]|uniref:olfactory receptor 10A7-like n=1 Tax=Pelodiscus sinensis TaxID=13735 RepID=UPI003F6C97AD
MARQEQGNQTSVTEFILLGFGDLPGLQVPLFLLFLVIYLVTMAGNIIVIVLVVADRHLHTPMYFFLGNLSCLEICYSSTVLPQLLAGLLAGDWTISFTGCLTQLYFFGALAGSECLLLSVMSYDRYLAICNPLHYAARMSGRFCLQFAVGSWIGGLLSSCITTVSITQLTFCGPNGIDHFFCDFIPIVKLSCNDPLLMDTLAFTVSLIFLLVPFVLTLGSYICILRTILRIRATIGRQKAFSTCSSHLIVVSIYYGALMIVYMFPTTDLLSDFRKVLSVSYTVLTPLVNPLIYALRNREVQEALCKACRELRTLHPERHPAAPGVCAVTNQLCPSATGNMKFCVYLVFVVAALPGVRSQVQLVQSGPGAVQPGQTLTLSCAISGDSVTSNWWEWVRQAPGERLQWMGQIRWSGSNWGTYYGPAFQSRATLSADTARSQFSLQLRALTAADTATYYCARATVTQSKAGPGTEQGKRLPSSEALFSGVPRAGQ